MTKKNPELLLRQLIARWSDEHLTDARTFIQSYATLSQRDLGNSQFYGLANVIRSSKKFGQVKEFMVNQAKKAERADKSKVNEFWNELNGKLTNFLNDAKRIAQEAGMRSEVDSIHKQLSLRFVQHLIAERPLWHAPKKQKKNRYSNKTG
ncbi:MAG: hypothetical protein D6732_12355 [Methanobacteriota archaeon]|nr:MAG: hypothetical protein D6732_12355 [Euryarchaeota archaeon]